MTKRPIPILIAEDNPGDVFLVRRALSLQALDVELTVAENGQAAIELIQKVDRDENIPCPQVILLDLNLPRATGQQILVEIRQSRRCSTVPVLVMTSSEASSDQAEAARLGASGYFSKPSSLAQFMTIGEIIRSMLERSEH
jgi:CheY-like chemotaxis protein